MKALRNYVKRAALNDIWRYFSRLLGDFKAIQAEASKPAARLQDHMSLRARVIQIARDDTRLFFAPYKAAVATIKNEVARLRSKPPAT